MALDGPRIVDGDFAHNIYSEFMDLYDADFSINEIKEQIETKYRITSPVDDEDFEDFEIFISTYSLALWEIGELDDNLLKELSNAIDKGAGVRMWLEESEKLAKQREKELKRLFNKVSIRKNIPRKRKKYKKVTNFIFLENDVVVFLANDSRYRVSIIAHINQYRGECSYDFTTIDYISQKIPTINEVIESNILIREIGSGWTRIETIKKQPEIDTLWQNDSEKYFIGLIYNGISHKDMLRFKDKFIRIGQIVIKEPFKSLGSIGYDSDYDKFVERNFADIEGYIKIFGGKKIPLKKIMKKDD